MRKLLESIVGFLFFSLIIVLFLGVVAQTFDSKFKELNKITIESYR